MAEELDFNKAELPDHAAWEFVHVENGTAIWARHADLDEFAARHNLPEEEVAGYRSTGADPSYQIELNLVDDAEYGVTPSRSTGPDSSGVLTDDARTNLDSSAALTHVVYLLKKFA